jgi:hypothetical protein
MNAQMAELLTIVHDTAYHCGYASRWGIIVDLREAPTLRYTDDLAKALIRRALSERLIAEVGPSGYGGYVVTREGEARLMDYLRGAAA